jgi:hypothetical protein
MNISVQNVTMNHPYIHIETKFELGDYVVIKTFEFGGQSISEIEDAIKEEAKKLIILITNGDTVIEQYKMFLTGNMSFVAKNYTYDGINLIRST